MEKDLKLLFPSPPIPIRAKRCIFVKWVSYCSFERQSDACAVCQCVCWVNA
jgi:hypothetical protein